MRPKNTRLFHYANLAADLVSAGLALVLAYQVRALGWPVPLKVALPGLEPYLQGLPALVLIVWICFHYAGLYIQRRGISGVDELPRLVRATTVAFVFILGFTFFYRQASYSRVVLVYAWLFTIVFVSLSRSLLRRLQVGLRRLGVGVSRLALAGLTDTSQQVAERIKRHPELGYKLIGFIAQEIGNPEAHWHGARVLGPLSQLTEIIQREQLDEVIFALPSSAYGQLADELLSAEETGASLKVVSDLFGIITNPVAVDMISGVPVFALKETPLARNWPRFLKRVLDLAVTLPGTLLLSPLLALIALGVKWSSPGPVFFRQERVGLGNRSFQMIKFRSMRQDAEQHTGPVWASKHDDRTTPLGAFLRRTSLDELPQVFNVLAGEMSLVGPRPERPHFVDQFKTRIPRYLERHKVKAGITGWAQINGLRGNTPIEERTKYDLWYVENWSLVLDLKILLRTGLEIFHHKDAY